MAARGGPRPGNTPPNYNPNSLADNMQNLQISRPTQPPHAVANSGGPRPSPPFGQQPPPFPSSAPPSSPFPGTSPMVRPRLAHPGVLPRASVPPGGPPQAPLPPNMSFNRSSGPPITQPPHPGSLPSSMGSPARPPSGAPPGAFPPSGPSGQVVAPSGSRPGPFASSPLLTGSPMPPSTTSSPINNGPHAFASRPLQAGSRFPSTGTIPRPPVGPPPSTISMAGGPPHAPSMRSLLGSQSASAPPGPVQPALPFSAAAQGVPPPRGSPFSAPPGPVQPIPPFSAAAQGVPPPSGSSPFSAPPQSASQPSGSPYGPQTWPMQPRQVAPPPHPIPGSAQPPRMFGMPPPLPTESMAAISPAMSHMGAPMAGPSKIDPNQIPRPIPSSSVILHETRQGNQANPPPPATSDYIVRDTGNCSPRYLRCTINQIPCTVDLLTTSGMQLALLVQPLALPHPSEEPIQKEILFIHHPVNHEL